jgi:RNA polymerase primary sigma factor
VPRQPEQRVGSASRQLTLRQERDLIIGAEAGDAEACRKLVAAFLPAIAAVASHFPSGAAVDRQELIQEGVAGLLFAARRFDTGRNTPFWAYASFWVRKAMQELVAELTRPVALSDRAVRAGAQLRTARREYLRDHGTEPRSEELSRATGLTRGQIESLDATEQVPSGDGAADLIVDPVAEQAFDQVLDEMEMREMRDFADGLDERERAVLRAHYGLGEPAQTLNEIGGALGLTAERARQIELEALQKLRDALAEPALGVKAT